MKIKVFDTIEHIKKNKEMYLGTNTVHPDVLASYVANDALVLGASKVIISYENYWYIIGSNIDWLMKGHDRRLQEIFTRSLILEGGGQNAFRREPLIMAFAEHIVLAKNKDDITVIKGSCDFNLIRKILNEYLNLNIKRILAFSL
jgi:hypothetical protein